EVSHGFVELMSGHSHMIVHAAQLLATLEQRTKLLAAIEERDHGDTSPAKAFYGECDFTRAVLHLREHTGLLNQGRFHFLTALPGLNQVFTEPFKAKPQCPQVHLALLCSVAHAAKVFDRDSNLSGHAL